MLLRCPEIKKRRELVCNKWLNINEGIAYREIINCTNVTKKKTTGKYLFETKCKGEIKKGRTVLPEVSWKLQCKMRKWTEQT
jgi:hypothetical protein